MAPACSYDSSAKPEPCPAPIWTRTLCPRDTSSSTPTGSIATRYSSSLISFGTPTIMIGTFSQKRGTTFGRGWAISIHAALVYRRGNPCAENLAVSVGQKKKILRSFAARHGAAARLAQIKRATALAGTIWANAIVWSLSRKNDRRRSCGFFQPAQCNYTAIPPKMEVKRMG